MRLKVDLHIHTTCSDGRMTPSEAVELADERKLAALSITDHDTFDGYEKAKIRADELGIELIPGVEITSTFEGKEAHLLAYYFDQERGGFSNFLKSQRVARRERMKGIIRTLNSQGVDVDYPEVRAEANGANIGRPHLAKVLIQKGYARSLPDAFMRYLSINKLGEISSTYPVYTDVIEIVKNAGGAVILAHPGRLYTMDEVDRFILAGIDGLECIHPSHNFEMQKKFTKKAEQHSLLMTGGSDYHGKKDASYTHVGIITLARKYSDKMKHMTEQRKNMLS